MNDISFGKITTSSLDNQGNVLIESETYYEGKIAGIHKEIEKSSQVTRQNVLGEIIDAINIDSPKITITLTKTKDYEPKRMVVKWTKSDERMGKPKS